MNSTSFVINGAYWVLEEVDPNSVYLVDRTNQLRVATTDPYRRVVYLSNRIRGEFKTRVLTHELGHVIMFSYGLLDQIHALVEPRYWIPVEEWICNFIADYGYLAFSTVYDILGPDAFYKYHVKEP